MSDVDGISKKVSIFTEIIAPTTILSALLVYVGWVRNEAYYDYFGISQGVLELSVQDYALRSADVTFGAITRVVAVALVFVVFDRAVSFRLARSGEPVAHWIVVGLALVGVVSLVGGFLVLRGDVQWFFAPFVGAAIVGAGVILTVRFGAIALDLEESRRSLGGYAEIVLYMTLTLALFWATTLYAQDIGTRAAQGVDTRLSMLPRATIYSKEYLDLPVAPGGETRVEREGTTLFRYTGLFLMTHSNDRWFLVADKHDDGYRSTVVILQDSGSIRVEIAESS